MVEARQGRLAEVWSQTVAALIFDEGMPSGERIGSDLLATIDDPSDLAELRSSSHGGWGGWTLHVLRRHQHSNSTVVTARSSPCSDFTMECRCAGRPGTTMRLW